MQRAIRRSELLDIICPIESIDRREHVIIDYRIAPADGVSPDEASALLAVVTSLGTSEPLDYEDPQRRQDACAKVISRSSGDQYHYISIAYPLRLCEPHGGLTQLLSVACFPSEYNFISMMWVEDVHFPDKFMAALAGPRFGINGIREMISVHGRPLLGVIIKPRAGAHLSDVAESIYGALIGGADYAIDDELITNPEGEFSFESRVKELVQIIKRASENSGTLKWYVANVTASPFRAAEFAHKARELGANAILVNAFIMGLPSVEELARDASLGLPIITSNMGTAMLARSIASTGMSEMLLAKLSRVAGADAVYSGILHSSWYSPDLFRNSLGVLRRPMHRLAPSFPVVAGGLNLLNLWDNIAAQGPDIILQAGSAILGHPKGAQCGAEAFRAVMREVDPELSADQVQRKLSALGRQHEGVRLALQALRFSPK